MAWLSPPVSDHIRTTLHPQSLIADYALFLLTALAVIDAAAHVILFSDRAAAVLAQHQLHIFAQLGDISAGFPE